jgi:NADPH2:quinone reductase
MFTGPYGVFEDGAYSEWLTVRKENLCLIPDGVDDVSAAGIPVACLMAQIALTLAGFQAGKTVLAPAIGGSVGNAVTQLARALGAKHAISSTTSHAKSEQAKALGFNEVIDTSFEKLGDGVRRITDGYGADIVIDGNGGEVERGARSACDGWKPHNAGLFGRPESNHRRHKSDLATSQYQELHIVRLAPDSLG